MQPHCSTSMFLWKLVFCTCQGRWHIIFIFKAIYSLVKIVYTMYINIWFKFQIWKIYFFLEKVYVLINKSCYYCFLKNIFIYLIKLFYPASTLPWSILAFAINRALRWRFAGLVGEGSDDPAFQSRPLRSLPRVAELSRLAAPTGISRHSPWSRRLKRQGPWS